MRFLANPQCAKVPNFRRKIVLSKQKLKKQASSAGGDLDFTVQFRLQCTTQEGTPSNGPATGATRASTENNWKCSYYVGATACILCNSVRHMAVCLRAQCNGIGNILICLLSQLLLSQLLLFQLLSAMGHRDATNSTIFTENDCDGLC